MASSSGVMRQPGSVTSLPGSGLFHHVGGARPAGKGDHNVRLGLVQHLPIAYRSSGSPVGFPVRRIGRTLPIVI